MSRKIRPGDAYGVNKWYIRGTVHHPIVAILKSRTIGGLPCYVLCRYRRNLPLNTAPPFPGHPLPLAWFLYLQVFTKLTVHPEVPC